MVDELLMISVNPPKNCRPISLFRKNAATFWSENDGFPKFDDWCDKLVSSHAAMGYSVLWKAAR